MEDGVVARVLLKQDYLENGRFRQDALGDGTFSRGRLDSGHDVGGEDSRGIGEAIERFDRVDNAPLAVILQRFDFASLVDGLDLVKVVAKVQRVFQGDCGQRFFDEGAKDLDVPAIGPLGVLALLEANPQFDQFLFGCAFRYHHYIASHCSAPSWYSLPLDRWSSAYFKSKRMRSKSSCKKPSALLHSLQRSALTFPVLWQ